MPLSARWPPRGSPGERWRCRCLFSGPREGRCLGIGDALGGAGACRVGPRGGLPSGRWRGPGSRLSAVRLRGAAWCRVGRRWPLRGAAGGAASGADASKPRGAIFAPPEGGGPSVPWSASPRPRGGLVCRAVGGPPRLFRGRARWVLGVARLAVLPLRGGAAVPAASAGSSPEGVGLALAPGDAAGCSGQAPSGPFCRRASSFRGRSSACIAGVIASRRVKERLAAPPRRGRRVPLWVGRGRSSVVSSAGAPPWTSAPPKGVGCPGAALRRFSVRPEGFLERLPCRSATGADAVCRCSRLPEGRLESLLCRSAAGPTRPGSPR